MSFVSNTSQAQNRTTYYAPNQLPQMRPNPRWQQQGGRGQGGFQGMPSSLRQPGPRANIRHLAPSASIQGPRGIPTGAQRMGEKTHPLMMQSPFVTNFDLFSRPRHLKMSTIISSQISKMVYLINDVTKIIIQVLFFNNNNNKVYLVVLVNLIIM